MFCIVRHFYVCERSHHACFKWESTDGTPDNAQSISKSSDFPDESGSKRWNSQLLSVINVLWTPFVMAEGFSNLLHAPYRMDDGIADMQSHKIAWLVFLWGAGLGRTTNLVIAQVTETKWDFEIKPPISLSVKALIYRSNGQLKIQCKPRFVNERERLLAGAYI